MTATLALCIAAIVLSIAIGYKFSINTGLIAGSCAFVIGTMMMGFSVTKIIAFWPTNIAYFILICALFFGFAVQNGTVDKIGKKLLYLINGKAALIPWICFLTGIVLAGLGAGMGSIALMGPLTYPLAVAAGINPVVTTLAGEAGAVIGMNNPFTGQSGVVISNLIADAGQMPDDAFRYGSSVFVSRVVLNFLIVLVAYIVTKSYKAKPVEVEKPEAFDPIQKKTFTLLMTAAGFIVASVTLNLIFPEVAVFKTLSRFAQPQAVMTIAAVLAIAMKLSDPGKVIKALPLNTVLMISCFTMLMGVAQEAGLVDFLASVLGGNIPTFLLKFMFVLLPGCMSFFCSGTGVVFPLLFPIVLPIAQKTGINPGSLFICMTAGSMLSSLSPFSTGGSMMIAGCPDTKTQDFLSNFLILLGIGSMVIGGVLGALGFFDLMVLGG